MRSVLFIIIGQNLISGSGSKGRQLIGNRIQTDGKMIARIESGKSIKGMLLYNEDKVTKADAQLILSSSFAADITGMNTMQKLQRFQRVPCSMRQ